MCWAQGLIYLFLFVLVGSEENPGKEKEKGKGEDEIVEEGKVDRKEEEREGNMVRKNRKRITQHLRLIIQSIN